jgi:hypothetical protein
MVLCMGCNREFSATGYTMHVAHTRTSLCHAAHNSHLASLVNDNGDIDIDVDPTGSQIFEGDVFGEYAEDDFDWPEDEETKDNSEKDDDTETDNNNNNDSDNDSDSNNNNDSNDPGIELALTTHMLQPPLSTNTPSDQASDTPGAPTPGAPLLSVAQSVHPCAPSQPAQTAQPQTPQQSDYIIEPFPGDAAGTPLDSSAAHQSDFQKYQQ